MRQPLCLLAEGLAGAPGADAPAVAVAGGRVVGVGESALEMGFRQVVLEGLWLAPAAVDAHVHLHLGGGPRKGLRAARSWGLGGVRDLGHPPSRPLPGRWWSPPPMVVCSGSGICPHSGAKSWLAEPVDGEAAARRAVRARLRQGAGVVKVFSTGLIDFARPGSVGHPQGMAREVLAAIVAEAREGGVDVAVHASGPRAVRTAVEAGVGSIEHGFFLDEPTLQLMADKRVWWVPTIVAVEAHARDPARRHDPSTRAGALEIVRMQQQALVKGWQKGVALAMGTDAGSYGVGHGEGLMGEMRLWLEAGVSPEAVFRAATAGAAGAAGLEGALGVVAPGAMALLVGVRGDPRKDPLLLLKPAWRSWE